MKKILIMIPLLTLGFCATTETAYVSGGTCVENSSEIKAITERVEGIAKLGKIRDIGVGIGTGALAFAGLSTGGAAFLALALAAASDADIDTTADETRRNNLWIVNEIRCKGDI